MAAENPVSQIYELLQKLVGSHRQLMEIVRAERNALLEANRRGIEEATHAKQAQIEAIRSLEGERLRRIRELAMMWRRDPAGLTLSEIAIAVQGRDLKFADQLRSAQNALTILLQRITEENRRNQVLVAKSMEHVENMKRNVLGEATPKATTYGPQGQRPGPLPGARLISKEV